MVQDAEAHRSEDAAHRELTNARNELDSVAYQVQRSLNENSGSVPEHERARAEMLIADARAALEEQAPIDRVRALTGELHQLGQSLAATARSGASSNSGAESSADSSSEDSDDVIDAEFTAH
jgi:molecular chaperone DnaK